MNTRYTTGTLLRIFLPVMMFLIPARAGWSQPASFAGVFANESITLTLKQVTGQYAGEVRLEGQTFPVAAREAGPNAIQGTYTYYGTPIPFQATLQAHAMTVWSEGEKVVLYRKQGPAAASTTTASPTVGEIGDAQWGLYFVPPAGWEARKEDGSFLLGSQTEKGFILVMSHALNTLEELRATAAEGLHDGPRTRMNLHGTATPFESKGLAARFEGTLEGQQSTAYAVSVLSPHGGGATVLAAVEEASYTDAYQRHVEAIARSLRFAPPQTSPAVTQWQQLLGGARLTALESYYSSSPDGSYVGASSETVIDLCEGGYFNYGDKHALGVDGGGGYSYNATGSAGGNRQGAGRWEIRGQQQDLTLYLRFHNGDVMSFGLTMNEKEHTLLNDTRFFRTYANDMIPEHRPSCP